MIFSTLEKGWKYGIRAVKILNNYTSETYHQKYGSGGVLTEAEAACITRTRARAYSNSSE